MARPPYRVLFFSQTGDLYGGSERSLLTYLQHRDRTVIQPTVVLPADGSFVDALRDEAIPFIIMKHRSWVSKPQKVLRRVGNTTIKSLVNLLNSRKLLQQRQAFDLVYTNTLVSPMGALFAQQARYPHIWHAREFVDEDLEATYDWGKSRSMQFIDSTTAKIICNSEATKNKLASIFPPEKFTVVYNGFPELEHLSNPERQPIAKNQRVRLGIVGHVQPHKGQLQAVTALHRVVEQGVDAELSLVGVGLPDYMDEIKALAQTLGIQERVIWEGFIEDVSELYQQLDILLICSRAEPFGRTAVEALSHGCPVIGANNGGLPEIVQDGYNGLLYPPDDTEALSRCILRLVEDTALYKTISSRALASVYPRFSVSQYVEGITETIREVIENS